MSYGSETWIYLKSVQNMIKVFERWCYRRMMRISWTEHVTNEEVFNRANTKPTLLDGLLKRRLAFHGHLVRKDGITLHLMIGRLHGTRPRGRPRTTWLKDRATQANISYKEAITIPRDRKKWRSVGNPRRTPDEKKKIKSFIQTGDRLLLSDLAVSVAWLSRSGVRVTDHWCRSRQLFVCRVARCRVEYSPIAAGRMCIRFRRYLLPFASLTM